MRPLSQTAFKTVARNTKRHNLVPGPSWITSNKANHQRGNALPVSLGWAIPSGIASVTAPVEITQTPTRPKNDSNDELLFKYSSGRWLYNEEKHMNDRYVPFNVFNLQKIAADSVGRQRCVSIQKLAEGGFNRVFLLTMDDGFQVVAKIPYRHTVPSRYLTASEVATMDFLREKFEIPVPRVYAWSSEKDSNQVGAEYILMEKATGVRLGDLWWSLNAKQLLKVITQLVQYEAKLLQTPLSSYGSIYFKGFLSEIAEYHLFNNSDDSNDRYCIGPTADPAFWHDGRSDLNINRGPWSTSNEYFLSISAREKAWDHKFAKPRRKEFFYTRSEHEILPNDHIRLLDDFDRLVPYFCTENDVPVLRHPDLHLGNIFIDPTDLKITSILDWQGARALPYTIHAGYPRFLSNNGEGVSRVRELDRLPKNFDSLDAEDKEERQVAHIHRLSCQLYVLANAKHNRSHFDALQQKVNPLRAEVVSRAGLPWNGDLVAFRAALLEVINNWERFSEEPCPVRYSPVEIKQWTEEIKEWSEASNSLEAFRADLGINEEGWIASELYEESAERNRFLRREITSTAEPELQKEMWRAWPFKDENDLSEWKG